MSDRSKVIVASWAIAALGVVTAGVFVASLAIDWQAAQMEAFELIARVIGYALVIAIYALMFASLRRCASLGKPGKAADASVVLSFVAVVILCIHDVLLYEECGNVLEGTYTMAAFFALDIALVVLYLLWFVRLRKSTSRRAQMVLWIAVVVAWALYMVGDCLGYPVSHVEDWDEALMKLGMLLDAGMLLLLLRGEKAKS